MALIQCENASFAYEGHVVLEGLSVRVTRGEYLCVVGENGSGKSTLIKGLLGLIQPVTGRVSYGDGLRRNEIGYLPQRAELQRDFPASVREVVASGCHGLSPFLTKTMKNLAEKNMRLMGIETLRDKCFMELSGGQQQRVLLARALCATKTMLLLDEPVAGLDPLACREMYGVIQNLHQKEGLTVVMISHDIGASLRYADNVLHLAHQTTFYGTAEKYRHSGLYAAFMEGGNDA